MTTTTLQRRQFSYVFGNDGGSSQSKNEAQGEKRSEVKKKKKNEDRNITLAAKGLMDTIYSLDVLRMAAKKKRREKKN